MAINFPDSPEVNDYFAIDGKGYVFNGTSWGAVFAPSASVIVGPEGPIGATGPAGADGADGNDGNDGDAGMNGIDGAGYAFLPYEGMGASMTFPPVSTTDPTIGTYTIQGDPGAYRIGDRVRITGNVDTYDEFTYPDFEPTVYLIGRITYITPRGGYSGGVDVVIESYNFPAPFDTHAFLPLYLSIVGEDGAVGVGVPSGGTTGQVLAKIDATDYNTQWVNQSGGGAETTNTTITSTSQLIYSFNKYDYRSGTVTIQISDSNNHISYFGFLLHNGTDVTFNNISTASFGTGYIFDYWYPYIDGDIVKFVAVAPVNPSDPVKIRVLPNLLGAEPVYEA